MSTVHVSKVVFKVKASDGSEMMLMAQCKYSHSLIQTHCVIAIK